MTVKTFNQDCLPSETEYKQSLTEQVEAEGVDKGLNGVIFQS